MARHKMMSEVLLEREEFLEKKDGSAVSKFLFKYPPMENGVITDDDGDLVLDRKRTGSLIIEHSLMTELRLVGLQVWRGAFLLADFIFSNQQLFRGKIVLELGSGVGLSSIIASIFAREVICTDIKIGDILKLIERNFARNKDIIKSKYVVQELDFLNIDWPKDLQTKVEDVNIIMAADVIYDDKITEGFVKTLDKLLNTGTEKTAYVTLEKRYVFTVKDLDSVAPMYEEFLRCINRLGVQWKINYIPTNFDHYFEYERTKELIVMEIRKL